MQAPAGEALNPKANALKTSTLGRFAKIINGYKPSIYAGDSTNAALRIENGMSRFLSKKFCKFYLLIPLLLFGCMERAPVILHRFDIKNQTE